MILRRNEIFQNLWEDETQREVVLWRSSRLTARLGWEDPQVFEICICSLLCVRVGVGGEFSKSASVCTPEKYSFCRHPGA